MISAFLLASVTTFFVDPARGDDRASGTSEKPLRSISEAIARVPEPVEGEVVIRLAPGRYETTGGRGMPERSLQLARRMRPGASIEIAARDAGGGRPFLDWNGGEPLVDAREGAWKLRGLTIGSAAAGQKRGILATGPVEVLAADVEFRLRSRSDAGLFARRGARIALRGAIRLNDPPPEDGESFCGLIATDHGVIEFDERSGSTLVVGDGNLAASLYGRIALGCETATVTSRTGGNCLSIGNGGRIDLRNTETVLVAKDPRNTPIGLEDDGHVLAEDARIVIRGENDSAIALQKASALFCNDVVLEGKFGCALWASSGSIFVGAFHGDVGKLEASTGASIHLERTDGKVIGPIETKSGGVITLPK